MASSENPFVGSVRPTEAEIENAKKGGEEAVAELMRKYEEATARIEAAQQEKREKVWTVRPKEKPLVQEKFSNEAAAIAAARRAAERAYGDPDQKAA